MFHRLLCFIPLTAFAYHCPKDTTHCFTSLDIDYGFTMVDGRHPVYTNDGRLYRKVTNEEVPIENVITADGSNETKLLITANGSLPGPDIIIYQNQKITILVNNKLLNEAVTIHWHGIDQLGWPAMDGVAFVTQCPITPGQTFEYTFKPRFGGSYWYHSHMGNQRDAGLYGAFIVLRDTERVPFLNQQIVLLQEYDRLYDPVSLLKLKLTQSEKSHALLINGKGFLKDNETPILNMFELSQDVNGDSIFLFRIISAASSNTLLLEIPGLRLKIVETDGWQINPIVVDKLVIYPAERYNFEIDLNCAEQLTYNITVRIVDRKTLAIKHDAFGLAYITNFTMNKNTPRPAHCKIESNVLNCPFLTYPNHTNERCIPISSLSSTPTSEDIRFSVDDVKITGKTQTHFLNFAFVKDATINGKRFIWPTVNALIQPSELNTDCSECTEEVGCECVHSLDLESGSEVIMILLNLGNHSFVTHPIHMHGHTFEILKMEFAEVSNEGHYTPTSHINCSKTLANENSSCNEAFWANSSWIDYRNIPGLNLENPVRKDTIAVPLGGYVILRIQATNPGVWFMHCHIDEHMVNGMALMLNESFSSYLGSNEKYIPRGLPTCHSYPHATSPTKSFQEMSMEQSTCDTSSAAVAVLAVLFALTAVMCIVLFVLLLRNRLGSQNNSGTRGTAVELETTH